jgi:hypothetical protein
MPGKSQRRTYQTLQSIEEHLLARNYGLTDTMWARMTEQVGLKEFLLLGDGEKAALVREYGGDRFEARARRHVGNEWKPKPGPPKKQPAPVIELPVAIEPDRDVQRMLHLARGWRQKRYA